jgi:hypothetical protein
MKHTIALFSTAALLLAGHASLACERCAHPGAHHNHTASAHGDHGGQAHEHHHPHASGTSQPAHAATPAAAQGT